MTGPRALPPASRDSKKGREAFGGLRTLGRWQAARERKEQGLAGSLEDGGEWTEMGDVGACAAGGSGRSWLSGQQRERVAREKPHQSVWLHLYLAKDTSKVHRGGVRWGLPDCQELTSEWRRKKRAVTNTVVTTQETFKIGRDGCRLSISQWR